MTWNEILEIIDKARAGDRQAFGTLVERFQPAVFAVALARLRNVNDAQELTQEVFVHAMTKIGQLREAPAFVSWLKQIAVRMAINRMTRKAPLQAGEPEMLATAPAEQAGPLERLITAEQQDAVHGGLARLKPLDRQTLVAFYIQGHTLEEMARDFAAPLGTIKRRLHVARKRLKTQLERAAGKVRRRKVRRLTSS